MPTDLAASSCPRSIDWIPARNTSAEYAPVFSATYFVAAALGYLIVTLPMIRVVNAVERRLHSGLVGVAGGM